jgi:hypothetical protein
MVPYRFLTLAAELHDWELVTAPASFVRHGVLAAEGELASV